jgi:general secretion pathway protein B
MSFILDALKKSETERQRQSVPGLMDMGPAVAKPRFPVWILVLGALLGVNLIVLLVVLTRTPASPAAAAIVAAPTTATVKSAAALPAAMAPTPTAAPAATTAPAVGTAQFSPMDPVAGTPAAAPVFAPEIPVDGSAAPEVARAPRRPTSPYQQIGPSASASVGPQFNPQLRVSPPPAETGEVLPTLAEINLSGNHAIPELHLDIHVFAAKPAERFVFINNQKYKEGATLREGPAVERITRDGVVLSYQALRFFLPRQ